ncbi:RagB/SusD family nutrient uptake outer membrane protein [Echinicola jeungdonensis]|uniref:RagB/SusD family nutrient uptake outer membrane protein n=1 Tax=Echinicola jeungdonensis TaxID=709343 RepID=A0ABV5J1G2_9BACT|nr:RagB/SusD family nutrient uptake outer membrane protein [Echinicola jeungdonensis]MDN3668495.1 RagB/SusD family nutrient uptake outer membrane protein [Echinicola jeungdonensis]
MMNKFQYKITACALGLMGLLGGTACESFVDVVPDNVATIDHAFKLRNEAEKYLFTCYSYMPNNGDPNGNLGFLAGDEMWIPYQTSLLSNPFEIARGNQRVSNPYVDVWNGGIFVGIRHCNIFIENLEQGAVPDLGEIERRRWIGEAEFLKAYFHFYLLRMYGPIPIVDENLPIDAPEELVNVERQPVDEVVSYISDLLDQSAEKLPMSISDRITELGRVTRPVAKGLKAKLLLMAASPLFNGNPDMASLKSPGGEQLFNLDYDENKWRLAADAAEEAIAVAEEAGHKLYEFNEVGVEITDTTRTELSIRQAVCERWNLEHVWGNSNSPAGWDLQANAMAPLSTQHNHNNARKIFSAPLKIARQFYSENGVPINEDRTLDFSDIDELRIATSEERFYIEEGFETARINFDREPRFYASLSFDGGKWYKYDSPSNSDEDTYVVRSKFVDYAGSNHAFHKNVTGYFIKKLVDWNQAMSSSGANYRTYDWPEIRLADLYLMYAEALNEVEGPNATVFEYLDKIRERAGLAGVQEAWQNYSTQPDKYSTKNGLREIIHQERLIELAFEGHRLWDLKRWKKANEMLNQPIQGWNMQGETTNSYYQVNTIYSQKFVSPRDYFWPINEGTLIQNPNLVQNVGW